MHITDTGVRMYMFDNDTASLINTTHYLQRRLGLPTYGNMTDPCSPCPPAFLLEFQDLTLCKFCARAYKQLTTSPT